jgi:hypothetical protein
MPISAVNHGPPDFWIALGMFDAVAAATFGVLAGRARAAGRTDRYGRYRQAAWGLLAFGGLCLARIILLT